MSVRMLHDYVTHQAERRPEATAVAMDEAALTYGALERQSNKLARLLLAAGCQAGDRIGLLLPKSPATVAAMLATLKIGCIYVPVDPESPAARISKILLAADCRCVLVTAAALKVVDDLVDELPAAAHFDMIFLEQTPPPETRFDIRFVMADADALSDSPIEGSNRAEDPAHILFTSGSTGAPKGVVVTHANVMAFIDWANKYFGLASDDRVSCHSPLHFDLSTFDLYGGFAAGAEVHLVPPSLNLLPGRLTAFMRDRRLTQWFSVPSVLTYLTRFDAIQSGDFPDLKRLIWCGEVFPTPALKYWMERLPHAAFTNLYGPTEATIASSYFTVDAPPADTNQNLPIGRACGGEALHILDSALKPAEVGEIYISGTGLTDGYWRNTELTDRAFLQPGGEWAERRLYRTGDLGRRDADGLVHFLGRADTQIKSRGHRIELGEIETALHALSEIGEGVIVAYESGDFGGHVICCAYVPKAGASADPREIKSRLAKLVPRYMLPARWRCMTTLPANANGKVDRVALRDMFQMEAGEGV